MKSSCLGAALAASIVGTACAADAIPAQVRELVTQRVADGDSVGIVLGVVDAEGDEFFSQGHFSSTDLRPVDESTLFEIGSITKVFTAALLADLIERGFVSLDTPLQSFLPDAELPVRGRSMTTRDLVTHRSGLPRLPPDFDPADATDPYADYDASALLASLATLELSRDPGEAYEYSNLAMGLLGYALSQRAELTWEQLVMERITESLAMPDTLITLSAEQRRRLAHGHADGRPVANWGFDALAGAGALRSTARDMLRFVHANLEPSPTDVSKALRATHRGRAETGQPDMFVALGWHVLTRHGRQILWHNGGTGGYRAFVGFDPDAGRGVVVLTNSTESPDDIGLHLLEPKYELRKTPRTAGVETPALEAPVGQHELAPGRVIPSRSWSGKGRSLALTAESRYWMVLVREIGEFPGSVARLNKRPSLHFHSSTNKAWSSEFGLYW